MIAGNVAASVGRVVQHLSLLPFAVIGLITAIRTRRTNANRVRALLALLVPAALYLPLALAQNRWALALNLLLVVPAALGVQQLMHRTFPQARRVHFGMMLIPVAAATWWLPVVSLTGPPASVKCDPSDAVPVLADRDGVGAASLLLMIHIDYGPELLFRTPHRVLSIPTIGRSPDTVRRSPP